MQEKSNIFKNEFLMVPQTFGDSDKNFSLVIT